MKTTILAIAGTVGSYISYIIGGWDSAMTTLAICMVIDYITGFAVAAVFHKSPKSANGALESRVGFKGLCRKCTVLLMVLIANRLDMALGVCFIKDGVVTAYVLNDCVSIIENVGLMGVPMPGVLMNAIDMLRGEKDEQGIQKY
ncbi:MAG: phage holin family protein [Eubacteriales bacterium]|nr:phage holin family protein [Eubacteriales bacterium]